jgi:hypothetical protein
MHAPQGQAMQHQQGQAQSHPAGPTAPTMMPPPPPSPHGIHAGPPGGQHVGGSEMAMRVPSGAPSSVQQMNGMF